jgi:hypothetical protein
MNIKPTSTDSLPQPLPPVAKPPASAKHALHEFFMEEFKPEQYQIIAEAWKNNPEVRSEVLEKAKQLAADANYPTPAQLAQLAKMIVGDQVTMPPTAEPPPDIEPPMIQPPMIEPPVGDPPVSANG